MQVPKLILTSHSVIKLRRKAVDDFCLSGRNFLNAGRTLAEEVGTLPPEGDETEIPSVDWWVTSRCNLTCDFCYGPAPGKDPVNRREDILHAIAASSARAVTFCGGEPLAVREVDEYAEFLRRRGRQTVLNTNGEMLRRRIDQGFRLAVFNVVGISVDGPTPEVHREMRGDKADFAEVIAAARLVAVEPGVGLKIGTVVSRVNRDGMPALAWIVHDLAPKVWRLYKYSRRGEQNIGRRRHWLSDDEFWQLAGEAAELAAPVPTRPSGEAKTKGCLIVDSAGNVLQPTSTDYLRLGNCLEEPLDCIWAKMPNKEVIFSNKRWLSVLN